MREGGVERERWKEYGNGERLPAEQVCVVIGLIGALKRRKKAEELIDFFGVDVREQEGEREELLAIDVVGVEMETEMGVSPAFFQGKVIPFLLCPLSSLLSPLRLAVLSSPVPEFLFLFLCSLYPLDLLDHPDPFYLCSPYSALDPFSLHLLLFANSLQDLCCYSHHSDQQKRLKKIGSNSLKELCLHKRDDLLSTATLESHEGLSENGSESV